MSDLTETYYFKEKGKNCTDETLRHAKKRAEQLGINNIVVASYTGFTGIRATKIFQNHNLVIVSGMMGFREPNVDRMIPSNKKEMEEQGVTIIKTLHAFGTLGRAIRNKFNSIQVDELIAHTLRIFGQGVKVGCEIACMAADAGAIRTDEECIAIGGSGGGADTAIVLLPSNTHRFFDTKVKEIICKPRDP